MAGHRHAPRTLLSLAGLPMTHLCLPYNSLFSYCCEWVIVLCKRS